MKWISGNLNKEASQLLQFNTQKSAPISQSEETWDETRRVSEREKKISNPVNKFLRL